ncbi:flagellar filament capping protein FliD [Catenovulum sp. SM1970]|uniref:flagellar filament capping protein FliD n=1 Tax=Marinifaba aquimaris TaxID=2741323 RepID=UPI001574E5CB|nr:flagellar filament capping protein FliD [Marinifaba aquimaris]NTS75387.1 flagellar filament capping protein FliD [Marinifaba aquimaris]
MGIQSIGVGSGLDLDGLVTQLLEVERQPKYDRLDRREEELDAVISGLGKLKEKMGSFKDSVDGLRNSFDLQGRKAVASHPGIDGEGNGPFTAEAGNSATQGSYQISVEQLARGSRFESENGAFTSSSDSVSDIADTLTLSVGSDSFDIAVTAGMTMQQLRSAINDASDNFGVKANIIDTGTGTGAKLVLTSETTGAGNDLTLSNAAGAGNATLQFISDPDTANGGGVTQNAQNAKAVIDGLAVESATNEFDNVIEYVSFEVTTLSEVDYLDTAGDPVYKKSTLEVGADKDGLKNKITDFVDDYNALIKEIDTLTKYGLSEAEDDGPLAGDFMTRGIETGLASIISQNVAASELGTLFQIGISINDDGELEIGDIDEYGLGSGQEKLDKALDENYDDIATLFSDENGIANQLYDYLHQYTTYGGLLVSREDNLKEQLEGVGDERARVELQMMDYEQVLRDKYINLDLTVAKLNRTGNSIAAALGY